MGFIWDNHVLINKHVACFPYTLYYLGASFCIITRVMLSPHSLVTGISFFHRFVVRIV